MFAKGLEDVPTFFVCLDDPAFTKGLAIQKRAMVALSNYGSNWQFKHLSSTASASDVGSLFSGRSFFIAHLTQIRYSWHCLSTDNNDNHYYDNFSKQDIFYWRWRGRSRKEGMHAFVRESNFVQ
jgi:hypothetical protein